MNQPTLMTDPTGMYSWSEFGSDAWGVTKGVGTAVGKVAVGIGKAVFQSARVSTDPGYAVKTAIGAVNGAVSGTKELISNVQAEGGAGGALSAAYNQALDNYQGADAAGKAEMIATPLVETFAVLAGGAEGAKAPSPTTESALESLTKGANFEKTTTNGSVTTHQFSKPGASMGAEFSAAGGNGARVAPNGTKVKALDGSNSMNSRSNSTSGKPTIEVQNKDINVKHKIRYDKN